MSFSTVFGLERSAALSDALIAPVWVSVNASLIWASWRVSYRLFPADRWFQHIGHSCLIGCATIILVGTVIGSVGLLIPWAYLATVGLLALIAGIALKRSDAGLAPDPQNAPGQFNFSTSLRSVGWADVLVVGVWGSVVSFWICHTVIYGVCCFPSEWDTLMYHLPFVDHWLQSGRLYTPECHMWSNPANNEMIALWVVGPFSGDFLYNLANLPTTLLLACGALGVGRHIGLSFCFRHLAALAVVTHQLTQAHLQGAGNDVAAAGLFLCCLGYVLRYAAWAHRADLLLGVMALGLLAGIKYYALGYALIAILIAVYLITSKFGWRSAVKISAYGLVGLIVFGGYWYLRNLLATGAPLFPFGARTDGDTMADGYPAVWESTFIGNQSPELFDLAMRAIWDVAGPCHWVALLSLPVTASWALVSNTVRTGPGTLKRARAALAVGTIAAVGVWAISPFAVESEPGSLNQMYIKFTPVRYGLCPLSLCVLLFSLAANDLARELGRVVRWAFAAIVPLGIPGRFIRVRVGCVELAFATALAYQWDNQNIHTSSDIFCVNLTGIWDTMIISTVVLFGAIIFALLLAELMRRRRLSRGLFVFLLAGVLVSSAGFAACQSNRWHRDYVPYYDSHLGQGVFRTLTTNSRPGDTICVMDERYYPFFGSARQFHIVQPPTTQSADDWYTSHAHSKCNLLVVRPGIKFKWARIQKYIDNRNDLFRSTLNSQNHRLYVVEALDQSSGSPHEN